MRPIIKRILLIFFLLVLAVSAGFVGWASFPLGPGPDAMQAMQSDSMVTVENIQGWTVFMPANGQAETGFIFYPGGRVDYRSYAPVLKPACGARLLGRLNAYAAFSGCICPRQSCRSVSCIP